MYAVYFGSIVVSRMEKSTGRLVPAIYLKFEEARQYMLDMNSLGTGGGYFVSEVMVKPVKTVKVAKK
jgi:hypothetical protein